MVQIHFNRIYIIESLDLNDTKTGTNVHNDLLRYQEVNHPDFKSILKIPVNKQEWNQVFDEIFEDCKRNENAPIIHFEVHGSEDKDGLVLTSGELLSWEELYRNLVPINIAIKNELFITMAVCYGTFFLLSTRFDRPTAFRGIVGSFDEIGENDLVIRYEAFYQELFNSFDLNKSYERLVASNPDIPNSYTCLSAEYVFARTYIEYEKNECTDFALKKRAEELMCSNNLCKNRKERRIFIRDFKKKEFQERKNYFKESYQNFFLLDKYPELKNVMEFPCDVNAMKRWFNSSLS